MFEAKAAVEVAAPEVEVPPQEVQVVFGSARVVEIVTRYRFPDDSGRPATKILNACHCCAYKGAAGVEGGNAWLRCQCRVGGRALMLGFVDSAHLNNMCCFGRWHRQVPTNQKPCHKTMVLSLGCLGVLHSQ